MKRFNIDRETFDLGVRRATKALSVDESRQPTIHELMFGDAVDPFTSDDLEYVIKLYDYAQWYELPGAVLVEFIRSVDHKAQRAYDQALWAEMLLLNGDD